MCVLEERQLDLDEKPLVVQLNWNKDDREGRFVLKNENDILPKVRPLAVCSHDASLTAALNLLTHTHTLNPMLDTEQHKQAHKYNIK